MIREYEVVKLTVPIHKYGLSAGDKGTVVMIHRDGEGYEVEFFDEGGDTIAVVTCTANQVEQLASVNVQR